MLQGNILQLRFSTLLSTISHTCKILYFARVKQEQVLDGKVGDTKKQSINNQNRFWIIYSALNNEISSYVFNESISWSSSSMRAARLSPSADKSVFNCCLSASLCKFSYLSLNLTASSVNSINNG